MLFVLVLLPLLFSRVIFEVNDFCRTPSTDFYASDPLYYLEASPGSGVYFNDTQAYISDCNQLILNSSSFTLYNPDLPETVNRKVMALFKPDWTICPHKYLIFKTRMTYLQTGVNSPTVSTLFGEQVIDSDSDPRLSSGVFFISDFDKNITLGLALTNKQIFVSYSMQGQPKFVAFIPVFNRETPFDYHDLVIAVDPHEGSIIFKVDNRVVYRLYNIGFQPSNNFVVTEFTESLQSFDFPANLRAGYSIGSVLDAYSACNVVAQVNGQGICIFPPKEQGLVAITSPKLYVNPRTNQGPADFLYSLPFQYNVLFGQGGVMAIKNFAVEEAPI